MDVRFGFSAVPKWRSKGLLGVAIAAALVAETFVAAGSAAAAPPAPNEPQPAAGVDGALEAPDIASARTIARLENERVEVIGERTITSSTWALPDGTFVTGSSTGPIWVPKGDGDGTASEDWAEVDLTLELDGSGEVRPKAHPGDLHLVAGGVPEDGLLASLAGVEGQSLGLRWTEDLPEPRLEGPRAVYPDVEPGVDIVVEATTTGFEQFFVLTERPAVGDAPPLALSLVSEGLAASAADDGAVEFADAAGNVVAGTATPLVWDAALDAERQHPVTEPWSKNEGQSDSPLAPFPEWAEETAEAPSPAHVPGGATAPLPGAEPVVPEDAGQQQSEEAAEAGASIPLPLSAAAEITAPDVVELSLTPDAAFLSDPALEYPVVVDPAMHFGTTFDTFVQTGFSTDQSSHTELRIGTYDGGANVARTFLHFDLSEIRSRVILGAELGLFNWHSASCDPRNWQVWETTGASTGTRFGSGEPIWVKHWSTSSITRSGSHACGMGWVQADVTALIQRWSNGNFGPVAMGIKAENERDTAAWKKFTASDYGVDGPSMYIRWTTPPTTATAPIAYPIGMGTAAWTTAPTYRLTARAHDADGMTNMLFQVYRADGSFVWDQWIYNVGDNQVGQVDVPAGKLKQGETFYFLAHSNDGLHWNQTYARSPNYVVDSIAPPAPRLASADYPADGTWHKDANQPGTFTFSITGSDPSLVSFEYGLDKAPASIVAAVNGAASTPITPTTVGKHVLQVRSVDRTGNRSPIVSHVFHVGRAGLTSPAEGDQVVRRVRLAVAGDPAFTHVRFEWRRGPDSGEGQAISLPSLTRANGDELGDWAALTDLGGYATWDAGLALGAVAGPVQVRAALASSSTGSTAPYRTPWVTVTVSPDAQNAAADSVGPGSVNLLTGDYSLSSTDVDEFGLSVGRAASSRDPRAGLEPQAELLSAAQQTMSASTGFTATNATAAKATNLAHAGGDSLKITQSGTSSDSFAQVSIPVLRKGATYRLSTWVYVPSTTGLQPQDSKWGLRVVGHWQDSGGTWRQEPSTAPAVTNAWQQVTVDFTIPADARTGGHVRLHNGFSSGGKAVYFDDLSVRELWSPLGPEWSLGAADEGAGTAYSHISLPYPDVAALHLAGGGEIWFTGAAGPQPWWPEPGAESLQLTSTGAGRWRLTELDGTISEFVQQSGSVNSQLVMTSPPAASGATRMVYENVNGRVRLARMIAAVEPGVDGWPINQNACTTATPAVGCEVLQLVYATSTTATSGAVGTFTERLDHVKLLSAPSAAATQTDSVVAVKYAYDEKGRLREAWDPRIGPAPLKTVYDYDADGRVTQLKAPGELPWSFEYGQGGRRETVGAGDLLDRSSGRLLRVSRASLLPGSVDQTGPATKTTMVYNVPLTKDAGGPHDLGPDALATWDQRTAPTDATAIFGPEDPLGITTATATSPGTTGYKFATVHYLDASAREVNTATPSGPDSQAVGYIDTEEYDQHGNVVRSLSAGNRLLALGDHPSAAADAVVLGLGADTAKNARDLSTESTYSPDGLDLLRTRGPLVRLAVGNDPDNKQNVHDVTTYVYDEGKPDGVAYHLVTTQTDALIEAGSNPERLLDVEVTKNGYDPIDGADRLGTSSGWKIGQPTVVTFDAGGANLSALVRYDGQGRAVESRGIGSTGSDARTNVAVYYTAGTNAQKAECGNKPAYAGLPCMSYAAGAVTGHDPGRMADALPVKHVSSYNRYGSIASVTESAIGPVAGITETVSRTTVTEYDAADRVVSVALTGSGNGAGAPVAKTVNRYDDATGDVTVIEGVDSAGAVVSTVTKTFDLLGRMTRYEDGSQGWTTSEFDKYGKPTSVTDSTGATTSFTYNRAEEPRGFVTSVEDTVAGTISADYGPDGEVINQSLPGGVELRIGYDTNREPVSRTYVRKSDGEDETIAFSHAVENSAGQMVSHTTDATTKRYNYDPLGRLTSVQDTINGKPLCASRKYDYDARGNRLSLSSAVSQAGVCADPGTPGDAASSATAYTYDTADRLITESTVDASAWVYDPLGRITTAPVRGSPATKVVNGYFANDLIASQTIEGVARQTWSLDAIGRFDSYTNEAWAVGGDGVAGWQEAVTKVNHYDSDSDSPAWIAEDASLPDEITRYVDGLDGNLALETGKTLESADRVLQLIDLHGDVMTTLPVRVGSGTADWAAVKYQSADEFGNPTSLTTGTATVTDGQSPGKDDRYGWLGGKQRSADALAGVLLMGVRLYDPATGRFWSRDPSPGGNSTSYDYCSGDPVNCTDLDGHWGFFKKLVKKYAAKVARVAEVVATIVPGPIGAAAAAISAGAYAATGNKGKALEMGVTAAAAMIPGGGAMVKAGFAAARTAGKVAAKVGRSAVKGTRGGSGATGAGAGKIVIGETMTRVRAAAVKHGASTYEPKVFHLPDTRMRRVKNMVNNYRWLRGHMKAGSVIIDIGKDAARGSRSPYYRLERTVIKVFRYRNVRRG